MKNLPKYIFISSIVFLILVMDFSGIKKEKSIYDNTKIVICSTLDIKEDNKIEAASFSEIKEDILKKIESIKSSLNFDYTKIIKDYENQISNLPKTYK